MSAKIYQLKTPEQGPEVLSELSERRRIVDDAIDVLDFAASQQDRPEPEKTRPLYQWNESVNNLRPANEPVEASVANLDEARARRLLDQAFVDERIAS